MAQSTEEMTGPVRSAHVLDEHRLLAYLRLNIPEFPRHIAALQIQQFAHGQSNPTYAVHAGSKKYVLRKKPPGLLLQSAHAVEREYQVLKALQGSDVPVPAVHCLCTDAAVIGTPFYIMDFVAGRVFTDPNLPGVNGAERTALYGAMADVLAALHRVNVAAVGLDSYGRPENYCKRQVDRWSRQYKASVGELGPPPDPAMLTLATWLHAHIPPEDAGATSVHKGIVHGDFRLDNLIFHPTQARVVAVLDWELSTLGNQLSDAAYCCLPYHLPPGAHTLPALSSPLPQGIPSESAFLTRYCSALCAPLPSSSWPFYVALSLFRGAAIHAGIHQRFLQGNASHAHAGGAGDVAIALAAQALTLIHDSSPSPSSPPLLNTQGCAMGFNPSPRASALRSKVESFVRTRVLPVEAQLEAHALTADRWTPHPLIEDLKAAAQEEGLWNLWLPVDSAALAGKLLGGGGRLLAGAGLSNLEYAHVCEPMGRSVWAPEAFNCSAPDTGNMEVLLRYGTKQQQERYLVALLEGKIRSCFAMTEPQVASSDATNIEAAIVRDGREWVVSGRKWWTSGACDPRCQVAIVMGKSSPKAATHKQQSMVLVEMRSEGVEVLRPLTVFGFDDAPHGHAEMLFRNVRVPEGNMLLGEGRGFEIAQGRLGPGRLHHCMRLIGAGERGLEAMVDRCQQRVAFKRTLVHHGSVRHQIAESRLALNGARLLVLQAAWELDQKGNKAARDAIAMAKVTAPRVALKVLDAAMQVHGGAGVCSDFPLARLWAGARTLRIADGPDEVHLDTLARSELGRARL